MTLTDRDVTKDETGVFDVEKIKSIKKAPYIKMKMWLY